MWYAGMLFFVPIFYKLYFLGHSTFYKSCLGTDNDIKSGIAAGSFVTHFSRARVFICKQNYGVP